MTMKYTVGNLEYQFSDEDVVNPEDFIPAGESNPHGMVPHLLTDAGFPVALVFATCLQDAIDEACDRGKLTRFEITEDERGNYTEDDDRISYCGNASVPHDLESLGCVILPNPKYSFCAMLKAHIEEIS